MKITTWNVNGVRAWLNKGSWAWVEAFQPDLLCLQEIKALPEQLSKEQQAIIAPYQGFWHPAERKGYSGVATFARPGANFSHTAGLAEPKFDVEGRMICTDGDDWLLYNGYFPNGGRDHTRLTYKLDFYDHFLGVCQQQLKAGRNLIITGDLNTAHQEIDLKNPKQNKNTSGFLLEEREWITRYLEHGFVDVFRKFYPDKEQYTWWTYRANARQRNIGWRLDYFLVSESLLPRVKDVIIHDDILGSDHCPVTLVLD